MFGFRELSEQELDFVSGGDIIWWGPRQSSSFSYFYGGGSGGTYWDSGQVNEQSGQDDGDSNSDMNADGSVLEGQTDTCPDGLAEKVGDHVHALGQSGFEFSAFLVDRGGGLYGVLEGKIFTSYSPDHVTVTGLSDASRLRTC